MNGTSPVFQVLTGTGKTSMQKLPTVRIVCNTKEAVKEVIMSLINMAVARHLLSM
jgi:hypothetical protein